MDVGRCRTGPVVSKSSQSSSRSKRISLEIAGLADGFAQLRDNRNSGVDTMERWSRPALFARLRYSCVFRQGFVWSGGQMAAGNNNKTGNRKLNPICFILKYLKMPIFYFSSMHKINDIHYYFISLFLSKKIYAFGHKLFFKPFFSPSACQESNFPCEPSLNQ